MYVDRRNRSVAELAPTACGGDEQFVNRLLFLRLGPGWWQFSFESEFHSLNLNYNFESELQVWNLNQNFESELQVLNLNYKILIQVQNFKLYNSNSKCAIQIQTVLFKFKLCNSNSNCAIQIQIQIIQIQFLVAQISAHKCAAGKIDASRTRFTVSEGNLRFCGDSHAFFHFLLAV